MSDSHAKSEPTDNGAAPQDAPDATEEAAREASAAGDAGGAEEPSMQDRAVTEERDKLRDQLMRTAADFENFRKRTQRDLQDARTRGKEEALRELLPVVDNLERALAASQEADNVDSIREGVQMVLRLFEDASGRIGLERVKAVGERFDPARHEAIQQMETDEHPPGSVINEVVPGYLLDGRLIRAAMVTVARPAKKPRDEQEGGQGDPSDGDAAS